MQGLGSRVIRCQGLGLRFREPKTARRAPPNASPTPVNLQGYIGIQCLDRFYRDSSELYRNHVQVYI